MKPTQRKTRNNAKDIEENKLASEDNVTTSEDSVTVISNDTIKKKKKVKKVRLSKFQENFLYVLDQFKAVKRGNVECKLDVRGTVMVFKIIKHQ